MTMWDVHIQFLEVSLGSLKSLIPETGIFNKPSKVEAVNPYMPYPSSNSAMAVGVFDHQKNQVGFFSSLKKAPKTSSSCLRLCFQSSTVISNQKQDAHLRTPLITIGQPFSFLPSFSSSQINLGAGGDAIALIHTLQRNAIQGIGSCHQPMR